MHAVVHEHPNIVETLLNNGSNVHGVSKNRSSVMDLAVEAAGCHHDEHVHRFDASNAHSIKAEQKL